MGNKNRNGEPGSETVTKFMGEEMASGMSV